MKAIQRRWNTSFVDLAATPTNYGSRDRRRPGSALGVPALAVIGTANGQIRPRSMPSLRLTHEPEPDTGGPDARDWATLALVLPCRRAGSGKPSVADAIRHPRRRWRTKGIGPGWRSGGEARRGSVFLVGI
jgi:hypothetical protein